MKNIRRNVAIIGVASLLMSMGASGVNAQANKFAKAYCTKGITLSDQQKEQVKEAKIEFAKATKDLKNEMNELRAHKKTLMSAEKPNLKAIYFNIDKASDLKTRLKKEQLAMKLDMKSILTDKQKAMVANRPMRNKGMRLGGKGKMKNSQARMCREGGHNKAGFQIGNGQKMRNGKGQGRKRMQKSEQDKNWMNFSDEQQGQMKELRLAHMKESKELKFQAEELQLKQKHLMSSENIDEALVMKNIELLSGVQNKLEKMKVDHKMEVRKILTEDQLSLFLSHSGMYKGHRNVRKYRGFNN